jgi:heme o synthase
MPVAESFGIYYKLTKPGIIRANVMTGAAGFLLASSGNLDFVLFGITLIAIALIIASACVINNIIDREIDTKMERTEKRSLVTGKVPLHVAYIYALGLGVFGFGLLAVYTNSLTFIVGIIGVIDYVVLYGITKRRSVHGTLVGGVAGATSIVAGYTAVTYQFDGAALALFLIMFVWQLPHFYAIALFRCKDYQVADLPVLSVVKGKQYTQKAILACIPLFGLTAMLLPYQGYTGRTYTLLMLILTAWWLWLGLTRLGKVNPKKWGHIIFGSSLVILLVFSVLISVDNYLP